MGQQKRDCVDVVTGGLIINSAGVANCGADVTSSIVDIRNKSLCGIHIVLQNTNAVGVIYVKTSNYYSGALERLDDYWVNEVFLDGSTSITVSSGVAVNEMIHLADLGACFLKVFYDYTSGDGILDVHCAAKWRC
jgi:hypothetical protein